MGDGHIGCTAAMEKIVKLGGTVLLEETLRLITDVWDIRRDALDAPIVGGLALALHHVQDLDLARLIDALLNVMPRQLRAQAAFLKEMTNGTQPTLVAIAAINLYNRTPGRKILVSARTFGGGSTNSRSMHPALPNNPGQQPPAGVLRVS